MDIKSTEIKQRVCSPSISLGEMRLLDLEVDLGWQVGLDVCSLELVGCRCAKVRRTKGFMSSWSFLEDGFTMKIIKCFIGSLDFFECIMKSRSFGHYEFLLDFSAYLAIELRDQLAFF